MYSIESDFIEWRAPARIARQYKISRSTVYRHARALDLFPKRDRNVRAALARVIERGCETAVDGRALVAAVQAFCKIDLAGRWIDRSEHVNLNELFERMTETELEKYARDGELPPWFQQTVGATPLHSEGSRRDSK
jgi:hypothetical protein